MEEIKDRNARRLHEAGGRPGAEGFWRFAYERQAVWHRRVVRGLPAPWTEDPILRRLRFCNTQRELDRGTAYLLRAVESWRTRPFVDDELRAFNACAYRVWNNWSAWDRIVGDGALLPGSVDDVLHYAEHEDGGKTGPTGWTACYWNHGDALRRFAASWVARWPALREAVRASSEADGSLEPVFKQLVKFGGMGALVGFQAALDLRYVFPALSDDVWVSVIKTREKSLGTLSGSGGGAELVDPDRGVEETMRWLRDVQGDHLDELGLDWSEVAWEGKPRLSLADVEHTLCEYRKWNNARLGRGKQRRL